jgi:hypothetical protein
VSGGAVEEAGCWARPWQIPRVHGSSSHERWAHTARRSVLDPAWSLTEPEQRTESFSLATGAAATAAESARTRNETDRDSSSAGASAGAVVGALSMASRRDTSAARRKSSLLSMRPSDASRRTSSYTSSASLPPLATHRADKQGVFRSGTTDRELARLIGASGWATVHIP